MSSIVKKEPSLYERTEQYLNRVAVYAIGANYSMWALNMFTRQHPYTGVALALTGASYTAYSYRHELRSAEAALRSTLHSGISKARHLFRRAEAPAAAEPPKVTETPAPQPAQPTSKKVRAVASKPLTKATRASPRNLQGRATKRGKK